MIRRFEGVVGAGRLAPLLTRMLQGTAAETQLTPVAGPEPLGWYLGGVTCEVRCRFGKQYMLFRLDKPLVVEYAQTATGYWALVVAQAFTGLSWTACGHGDNVAMSYGDIHDPSSDLPTAPSSNQVNWGSGEYYLENGGFATYSKNQLYLLDPAQGYMVYDPCWVRPLVEIAAGPLMPESDYGVKGPYYNRTEAWYQFGWDIVQSVPPLPDQTAGSKALVAGQQARRGLLEQASMLTGAWPFMLTFDNPSGQAMGLAVYHTDWHKGLHLSAKGRMWWVFAAAPSDHMASSYSPDGLSGPDLKACQQTLRLCLPIDNPLIEVFEV